MPVHIGSRLLRVLIGSDEQDWSLAVAAPVQLERRQLRSGDFLGINGTITILPGIGLESIDPQVNPARWRPGQPVRIQITNSLGSYVDHPCGRLYILEEPEFPEPGGSITLELGCELTWKSGWEFDRDATGITIGTATNCGTITSTLLQANGISAGNISIPTQPYSLAIPDGKGPSDNFIGQAAELLYANDWHILYQATNGTITASELSFAISASPTVTITEGTDDLLRQGTKVEAAPAELIKVVGQGVATSSAENPSVSVEEVEGDRGQFSVDGTTCVGTGVISRAITRTEWEERVDDILYRTTVYLEAPRSAVAKDPTKTGGLPCSMINWKQIITTRLYDLPADGGKLKSITETTNQRRFTLTGDDVEPILSFQTVKLITTTPTYSDESVTRLTEAWRQVGSNTWRKTSTTKLPKALENAAPGVSPFSLTLQSGTTTTSTGANQPPRAEVWDGGLIDKDLEFTGTATYTPPGGASGYTKKEQKDLRYGFSDTQCEIIARKHVALNAGRHRAALLQLPITDALLSAPPLFQVDYVDSAGDTYHYLADGVVWEHGEDRIEVFCTGIQLGVTPDGGDALPLGALDVVNGADDVVDGVNDVVQVG